MALLNLVSNSLNAAYENDNDQFHKLIAMTNQIQDFDFCYEAESKKLSKTNKALQLSAVLVARVDYSGQNAFLRIKDRTGEIRSEIHLLTNHVYEFNNNLHRTRWNGSQFEIYNKRGQLFKSFAF